MNNKSYLPPSSRSSWPLSVATRARRNLLLPSLVLLLQITKQATAVDNVWRALELANNTEMAEMITTYQRKEHEHSARKLQQVSSSSSSSSSSTSTVLHQLGDKCGSLQQQGGGDTSNEAICTGSEDLHLECTRVGLLAKRCFPLSCLEQGLKSFHQQFGDMAEYQQDIWEKASVTQDELRQTLTGLGDDKREFLHTDIFRALQQAIQQHAAPADAIFDMYDQCTVGTGRQNNNNGTVSRNMDRVTYLGLHLEAGLLIDVAFDVFWEYGGATTSNAFVRYCIGGGVGGGAEITFLYLMAQQTSNPEAIAETCHFIGDVDFGLPVALGVGYGTGLNNGIGILEMTAGVGVEISAGVSFCGVSKA